MLGVAAAGVGVAELLAWFVHPAWLASGSFVWLMKANTAVAVILIALALRLNGVARTKQASVVATLLCGFVLLLGVATLSEYLTGASSGIDRFVAFNPAAELPGRMSPQTAIALMLMAISVATISTSRRWVSRLCDVALVGLAALVLLAVTGYVYDVTAFYGLDEQTRVSPQSIIVFGLLLGAIMSRRAGTGALAVLLADAPGSQMARWLLPAVMLMPLVLGELDSVAERLGWIAASSGAAAIVVAHMFLLVVLLSIAVVHINRADQAHQAERARRRELERYVVMCAWTRRIRMDGVWVPVETFLEDRFGIQVSHGISDEAIERPYSTRTIPRTIPRRRPPMTLIGDIGAAIQENFLPGKKWSGRVVDPARP